ncbi:MAG: hypothetical protein IJJ22_00405, partial [Oscillospiraceae bacterium]|nr:hypothetical protein [Oscillospiraceae bacterium]
QYKCNVAVCNTPAGAYEFYGFVSHADGTPWGEREGDFMPFDPGVLVVDDRRIYLFAGQGPINRFQARSNKKNHFRDSAMVVELEPDMKTMRGEPRKFLPNCTESKGTGFEHHEFFEASSIRKFKGNYYFIYSSVQSHELVYAVSDRPDCNYRFGGILHSNGDIADNDFLPGRSTDKRIRAYFGNNHGSIAEICGHYYIFGHRHTNASMFSRQGVAEEIFMDAKGNFTQAEMTSCGLNNGALMGIGTYQAAIACNLQSRKGACLSYFTTQTKKHPRLTQDGVDRESGPGQYIANLRNGALAGFKYFNFENARPNTISVQIRGKAKGILYVYNDIRYKMPVAIIPVDIKDKDWVYSEATLCVSGCKSPLFFLYRGKGAIDFSAFSLQ